MDAKLRAEVLRKLEDRELSVEEAAKQLGVSIRTLWNHRNSRNPGFTGHPLKSGAASVSKGPNVSVPAQTVSSSQR